MTTPTLRRIRNASFATSALGGALFFLFPSQAPAGSDSTEPEQVSKLQCLRKASLDLRNQGPSQEDIEAVRSGSATVADMINIYLDSPAFERQVFNWYRTQFPPTELSQQVDGLDVEEPSRIAQHIVVNDLDYRTLLTGDFTVSTEGEVSSAENGPAAGVLSTQHYMSAFTGSFRRNWAGHFLKEWTPIVLEAVTLPPDADPEALDPDSLMTDPQCSGCHASDIYGIDYLAPFSFCYDEQGLYDAESCDSESPARFLTEDGATLQDLGQIVADSNEFMAVSVNFFYEKLFGRSMAYEERSFYVDLVTAFRASNYSAKTLIREIAISPYYCAQ